MFDFSDLTFFSVKIDFTRAFRFATLEKSLGMKSIDICLNLKPDHRITHITYADINMGGFLDPGFWFAETQKFYNILNIEELKSDYLIAKLSGLRQ